MLSPEGRPPLRSALFAFASRVFAGELSVSICIGPSRRTPAGTAPSTPRAACKRMPGCLPAPMRGSTRGPMSSRRRRAVLQDLQPLCAWSLVRGEVPWYQSTSRPRAFGFAWVWAPSLCAPLLRAGIDVRGVPFAFRSPCVRCPSALSPLFYLFVQCVRARSPY